MWTAERVGAGVHRVVPDGCVDILVDPDRGTARVVGTMTRAVLVEQTATRRWVAARFRPGRAFGVLGPAVASLNDEQTELEQLWPEGARLIDAVCRASTVEGQVRAMCSGLAVPELREAREYQAVDALLAGARVAEVARSIGWSRQHLTRRVRATTGLRPSLLRRVGRLGRLLGSLPADPCWTDLAFVHGYADSAHLTHDFQELVGVAPSRFGP